MEHYLALFEPDRAAGGYVVTFPDFGYGVTQGESHNEAMEMAQDLLMLTIGDYIRKGKKLPAPPRRQLPRGSAADPANRQSRSLQGVSRIRALIYLTHATIRAIWNYN
jgi:predicted RNase H-like HicB family nuclease